MYLPKISIVTPSLNQGNYLEETILSVLNQNYPNLEYIIIDGGSEDASVDIIRKYSYGINYWISEKDSGQSSAINKGIEKCTGDIITWLNSDDCYLDGTLQKVAQYFSKGDHALLYGKSILFGKGRRETVKGLDEGADVLIKCLSYVPFPQPSSFLKRRILLEQGNLDESLHYGMDHDLFARIAMNNYNVLGVEDIFSRYRLHEGGKSNLLLKFAEERSRVFSKVLRSFPSADMYIYKLAELGFYMDGKDRYPVSRDFDAAELGRAFVYFLEVQMHYYYLALDLKNSNTIAKFLQNYNVPVVDKQDARKIYFRSIFLNRYIISFLRKFTQN